VGSLFATSFVLGFLLCLLPGAASAEAIRRGLAGGFRSAVIFELGTLIGDAAWAVLALAGAAVLVQNRLARLLLSIVGAAVLLRLAILALRDALRSGGLPIDMVSRARNDFAAGALISLGNPSHFAFWLGVGGAVVAAGITEPTPIHFGVFFGGFMLACVLWCFVFPAVIAGGRRFLSPPFFRWANLLCGLFLGYFGLMLLWSSVGSLS
jgi:chemosensory pili system protein ChpE